MDKTSQEKKRYAVLIDTDNISSKYVSIIFRELSEYGDSTYRRAYGNWSKGNGWKEEILLENSILPIHQFSYTTGKNSTDMAMVIDAMDILHSDKVDGFCLITSDSDFTRLAMRLREENMNVIGMGESKVPVSLAKACNKFIYLDIIYEHDKSDDKPEEEEKTEPAQENIVQIKKDNSQPQSDRKSITKLHDIEEAINKMLSEKSDGTIDLGEVGSRLGSLFSDFDVRNYGYTKLGTFIKNGFGDNTFEFIQKGRHNIVQKKNVNDKEKIVREIFKILEDNGGQVNNLSIIHGHLKSVYPNFNVKDYGYGKLSTFVKNIGNIKIEGNTVKCIKKAKNN